METGNSHAKQRDSPDARSGTVNLSRMFHKSLVTVRPSHPAFRSGLLGDPRGTSGTSCRSDRRAACGAWTPAALRVAIIFVKILPNMHGSRPAPFPVVIRDCGISAVGLVSIGQDFGTESDGYTQIKSYQRYGAAKARWLNLNRIRRAACRPGSERAWRRRRPMLGTVARARQ